MFIQRTQRKTKDKVYHSVALLENYREGKKVRHRTIASLTKWPKQIVDDLEELLKGRSIISISDMEISNGKAYGAIEVIKQIAGRLGISQALGNSKQAKLAMVQIAGRIIAQQSRNNKHRAEEITNNRQERIEKVKNFIANKNQYLREHPKASAEVAQRKIEEKISQLKLKEIITIDSEERKFNTKVNEFQTNKQAELDGCYVVKTEVPKEELSTQVAHDRYKDLGLVEYAFRTMKTTIEELRPIFVRKEKRTRGHVFVVMLAYMVIKYISDKIQHLGYTRKFVIDSLDRIQYIEYVFKENIIKIKPTKLPQHTCQILEALEITEKVAKKK